MRPLAFAGLLLALGCSDGPAGSAQTAAPAPAAAPAPIEFEGLWTVTTLDGRPPPPAQSHVLITVGADGVAARADCAQLGRAAYFVQSGTLVVTPAPPGLITSCTRSLSGFETDIAAVLLQPGAVGRLRDDRLVVERAGRVVEAARGAIPGRRPLP